MKQIKISKLIKLKNIGPLFYLTNIVGHFPLLFQYAIESWLSQLKIKFFSPSLKKVSFNSVMFSSYDKCVTCCALSFCQWNWRHCILNASCLQIVFHVRIITIHCILSHAPQVKIVRVHIWWTGSYSPLLIILSPKILA